MKNFFKRNFLITPSMLNDKPLTFSGAASHWAALHKWTGTYLVNALQASEEANLFLFDQNYQRHRLFGYTAKSGFEQVLHGDQSQRFYLKRYPLRNKEEKLLEDIEIPTWIKDKRFYLPNIWAGQAMSMTPLHYDSTDGYLCQVAGYKRVYLFSPEDSLYLYPKSPLTGGQFNFSEITQLHTVPLNSHSYFLRATVRSILLKPGDTLYIPQGWWHQIFNLTYSVAVNFFFTNEMKGYSPKQEILIYQACKNSERDHINKILNRGHYELCLQNTLELVENNYLDYACYFVLTYLEEYLKANFLQYYFLEHATKDDSLSKKLHILAISLFNSRQSEKESEKYYHHLEQANNHLKTYHKQEALPDYLMKKGIALARKTLQEGAKNIKVEDIIFIVEEVKAICAHIKSKSQQEAVATYAPVFKSR